MRQLHNAQRGSANWAFIITLLIMLAFVYLWWTEKDEREAAQRAAAEAEEAEQKALDHGKAVIQSYAELSSIVGYADRQIASIVPDANLREISQKVATMDDYFTDVNKLRAQLEPEGVNEDGSPGLLNFLISKAEIQIARELRRKGAEGVKLVEVNFEAMKPELREKLKEIAEFAKSMPRPPVPVMDSDDEADKARYEAEKAAYDAAVDKLQQMIDEFQQMEGAQEVIDTIKGPGAFDPDKMEVVKLDMFEQDLTGKVTVADLVTFPPKVIENFKSEFKASKEEDQAVITRLQGDSASKASEITDLQQQLAEAQTARTTDVEQLRNELAQANEQVEDNRRSATTALSDLAQAKDEKDAAVTERDTRIRALEERIRLDKETRDLEIRRDDPDGRVLASSPRMGTAMINLGSNDKVYPGLKFVVWRVGRGGVKVPLGKVSVVRVLGPKQAKVAIVDQVDARNPILGGDIISNAFFNATKPIHVYLAGELETYPVEVVKSRLGKMNVIVQARPNGDTDYIIVPDAIAAPPADAAGDEGEEDMEEEEGPVGGQSEYERLQSLARGIGATVITERMLNNFLGL